MKYDIIGDIHGYAQSLTTLLKKLGYRLAGGSYSHPEEDRQAVFLGDFIDRGPAIRETLGIVRPMVEKGNAVSVMGNHEYNAIGFNKESPHNANEWLRSRNSRHIYQHIETLYQFKNYRDAWQSHLEWFRTLPLYLELDGIRVVHASWDPRSFEVFRPYSISGASLTERLLENSTDKGTSEFNAIQNALKGIEVDLPDSVRFVDKDGFSRKEMRVKWWESVQGKSMKDLIFPYRETMDESPIPVDDAARIPGYDNEKPVFFGHYWLKSDKPSALTPFVACLDYSVAGNGILAAYSWNGERELVNENFSWV